MDSDDQQMSKKDRKVEIPSETTTEIISGGSTVESHPAAAASSGQLGASGLRRQPSVTKNNCLCSPTTHAGSFRCRLHRPAPSLHRNKTIDSQSASLRDSTISKPNSATAAAE